MENYLNKHHNDLVRQIEYHQKMEFELKENLKEWQYLIETKQFDLAKKKLGI